MWNRGAWVILAFSVVTLGCNDAPAVYRQFVETPLEEVTGVEGHGVRMPAQSGCLAFCGTGTVRFKDEAGYHVVSGPVPPELHRCRVGKEVAANAVAVRERKEDRNGFRDHRLLAVDARGCWLLHYFLGD